MRVSLRIFKGTIKRLLHTTVFLLELADFEQIRRVPRSATRLDLCRTIELDSRMKLFPEINGTR